VVIRTTPLLPRNPWRWRRHLWSEMLSSRVDVTCVVPPVTINQNIWGCRVPPSVLISRIYNELPSSRVLRCFAVP
jgi:hypothetical protein